MTRVDFYILKENASGNRYTLACRIAEKAWRQGHRVLLHTTNSDETRHLDRLLWTFREQSFVPHGPIDEADAELTPILIEHGHETVDEHDVLVNLAAEPPPFLGQFERVAEIIDNDPEIRRQGRLRYRFYKDHGYPLDSHEIA